jgi:diguanylate cyclase (GGDEF)-like protein
MNPVSTAPKHQGQWKPWVLCGFLIVIVFTWLNEILDLPHVLLAAPATPINLPESLLETVFTLFMAVICWLLIRNYELRWVQATEKLQVLATTDELSGMLNRREFLARAEKEFERAQRFGRPLSIAILDLDDFKAVNDRFGHLVGDRVIRELCSEISLHIRREDLSGRFGGDEFILAMVESTRKDAKMISSRILSSWQTVEMSDHEKGKVSVTFSVGLTAVLKKDRTLLDCIQRADKALYNAKKKGGDQITIA